MMATVNVTITQPITLYLLDQYCLRYVFKKLKYMVSFVMSVKSNKYIIKYSRT